MVDQFVLQFGLWDNDTFEHVWYTLKYQNYKPKIGILEFNSIISFCNSFKWRYIFKPGFCDFKFIYQT